MHKFYSSIPKVILIFSILSLIACGGGGGDSSDSGGSANSSGGGSGAGDSVDAALAGLTLRGVDLDQVFQSSQPDYSASIGFLGATVHLDMPTSDPNATARVNGALIGTSGADLAVAEGANAFDIEVTAEDGVTTHAYTLEVTRGTANTFAQRAYAKASNTGAGDEFGWRVALDGDTLAVGATGEASSTTGINGDQTDNSQIRAGAVYVFTRSGGVWSQQAYVKASNTDAGDLFGYSVALDGDTLAVGAYKEASNGTSVNGGGQADNSTEGAGAVYVFTRSGGVWSQQAYVKASNTSVSDYFGWRVALDGDTLAVGAIFEDSNGTGVNGGGQADNSASAAGAVYVFTRSGGVWSQQAYVKASNTAWTIGSATAWRSMATLSQSGRF